MPAQAHDKENMLFSTNGVAGLVFYGFLVLTVVLYMTGHKTPGNVMLVIFLGIPVLLFVFKEPLGKSGRESSHKKMEGGKVMFFVQGFFELFETHVKLLLQYHFLCAYRSICSEPCGHDGSCADALPEQRCGKPNWIVFVIGNIVVCGLEGLVVGIQVLRLEYYEMFSRFYKGSRKRIQTITIIKNRSDK